MMYKMKEPTAYRKTPGTLDILGNIFVSENFQRNRFEQLCVNYTNKNL